jgi:putative ABC transport system permease protein
VLEEAPKFHVMLARFDSTAQSAVFQRSVVQEFPNISIIDLNLILQTVDSVLSKVSFVIRFMAFFSILTGLLVLTGSVIVSKYQRIEESVLLRTLGASRAQIFKINVLEYFLLGSIAAFTGIFIALGAGWALASFSFDSDFRPDAVPLILGYLAITLLTVFIGLSNSRSVVMKPPLEILRSEV